MNGSAHRWVKVGTVVLLAVACGLNTAWGAANSTPSWIYTAGNSICGAPIVGPDGTVYFSSLGGWVRATNPSDGSELWHVQAPSWDAVGLAIGTNNVLYVTYQSGLCAFSSSGSNLWAWQTAEWMNRCPVIGADGTIYAGCSTNLFALNPDGSQKWRMEWTYGALRSLGMGGNGTLYVGYDGDLYAFYPDGTQKWQFSPDGDFNWSCPAVGADGTIYIGAGSGVGNLYAIQPNGVMKWVYASGGWIEASPVVGSDGTVYAGVGYPADAIIAVNPDTGRLKWSYATDAEAYLSPAIGADGTIYAATEGGTIYALNPDGTLNWSYATGSQAGRLAATIGPNGTLYISTGSKVYAFTGAGVASASPWPMLHHDARHTGAAGSTQQVPEPCLFVNGVRVSTTNAVTNALHVTVSLDPGSKAGVNADWWALASSPFGWYAYVANVGWQPTTLANPAVALTAPLVKVATPLELFGSTLPAGDYTFYFGIDLTPDGILNSPIWYDSVSVHNAP